MKMHIGYSGKYVSIYNKPLAEAKESDRVCRFPRTQETEQLARAMVSGLELLDALIDLEEQVMAIRPNGFSQQLAKARAAIAKATGEDA